jgi:prepilin-type N-terminal cleavage/methylation domain-containing protein
MNIKTKAFTLVELAVVTAIISILAIVVIPNLNSSRKKLALERSATKLAQDIRWAQQMAMSSEESQKPGCEGKYSHGIYFKGSNPDKYIIYIDCNNNDQYDSSNDDKLEDIFLEDGITFTINNPQMDILFVPPSPVVTMVPVQPNNEAIINLSEGVNIKKVYVNKVGLITVE